MLTQADIDEAVSEALAMAEQRLAEYADEFERPMREAETARQMMMAGGADGQQ